MKHAHHFAEELTDILGKTSIGKESIAVMVHSNQESGVGQLRGRES